MYFEAYENQQNGVRGSLHDVLKEKVMNHRMRFIKIFFNRYIEMLPTLITYKNTRATSIDFLKVEVALIGSHDVVIGEATNGKMMVLGYATNRKTIGNPTELFYDSTLKKDDIKFIVPEHLIPLDMKEISYKDNCVTGNFVVLRNKILNYVSDVEIIQHFTEQLSEIVVSRYSLTMQAKIQTFFKGDENDETISKLVADLYNGAPYVKTSKVFDEDENIVRLQNDNIAQNFKELKTEYQNVIGEMNNSLGINSLAVDKQSGVSDTEAKSNRSLTTSIANIKLGSRNDALRKLNRRFGLKLEAIYNDDVASEISDLALIVGDDN